MNDAMSDSERWVTGDDVLAVVGAEPATYDDVVERLTAAGFDDVEIDEIRLAIRDEGRVADMESGLVSVPALFDGVRWTVEVFDPSSDDVDDDVRADFAPDEWLVVDNGAEPLSWWLVMNQPGAARPDGGDLGTIETEGVWRGDREIDVFCADDGWLAGALPSDRHSDGASAFVEVTAVDGVLQIARLDAVPAPTPRQIEAVRASFVRVGRTETLASHIIDDSTDLEFSLISSVTEQAVALDRDAFVDDPSPPHDDLLIAAGLEVREGAVARRGFDWTMLDAWRRRNQLVSVFGFSEEQAEQLQLLGGAATAFVRGEEDAFGPPEERLGAATLFAAILERDVEVGEGFIEEWLDRRSDPEGLLRFADEIIDILGESTPGVGWLRATALDRLGRPTEAVEELARHTSSNHEGALVAAAAFAADRSDGVEAHRLLQRAGALDHLAEHDGRFVHETRDLLLLSEILPFASRPRAAAKRNDPCPCGSGKKYKTCHLGSEMHPIADRAAWLDQKAERFAAQRAENEIEDLAANLSAELGFRARESLRTSPFVSDIVRHEGGVFERFLGARSMFLPDDEAELAASWTTVDRSVFTVVSTQRHSMRLRDHMTDAVITVSGLAGPTVPDVGLVIVGRPLPVGDTYRAFSGFIEIRSESVDDVVSTLATGHAPDIAKALGTAIALAGAEE